MNSRWFLQFLIIICLGSFISLINIEQTYSPFQYNGPQDLENLLTNYNDYKTNFNKFVFNTYIFNEGDTEAGRNSFYYLLPVFIGVDLMGGLSFGNLCRVSAIYGILSIIMLFFFLKRFFGLSVAFASTLFYSFSAWYCELFRAGTYHGPTVLIALFIIYICYWILEENRALGNFLSFLLGIIVAISYYYYGVIRSLLIFSIIVLLTSKHKIKSKLIFFFPGISCILIWGILLRYQAGGSFFDQEHFLTNHYPWLSLLERAISIFCQIFSKNVHTAWFPSRIVLHSRLLHPILFAPFVLGIIIAIRSKQRKYQFLNLFSLILYLTVLVTNNAQVRRMSLLIIPVYVYVAIGSVRFLDSVKKIKNPKTASLLKGIFLLIFVFIISTSLLYIKKNILEAERTLGFIRIAQKVKRQNIQTDVFLLMDGIPDSLLKFMVVDCKTLIEIENYNEVLKGNLNILEVYFDDFLEMLSTQKKQEFYLIKTPFIEDDIIKRNIKESNFQIFEKGKVPITPAMSEVSKILKFDFKSDSFEILQIKL